MSFNRPRELRTEVNKEEENVTDSINSDASNEKNVIVPSMIQTLYSDDIEQQIAATNELRKLLQATPPLIDEVIQKEAVPALVELLKRDENAELQVGAANTLRHTAAGTLVQARSLIDANALPVLIRLLNSKHANVQEQAAWTLGNIARRGPTFRESILSQGVMTPLVQLLSETSTLSLTTAAVQTLSVLCTVSEPPVKLDAVSMVFPLLPRLLTHKNHHVLSNACVMLAQLCNGPDEKIRRVEMVINSGLCPMLAELITHTNDEVVYWTLLTLTNVAAAGDVQTQVILDCDILRRIRPQLGNTNMKIRKAACMVISNITAGSSQQIQAVIDNNVFPSLLEVLAKGELETRKEALWATRNATSGCTEQQLRCIVCHGCIPPLCDLLTVMDVDIVYLCVESLTAILDLGEHDSKTIGGSNPYADEIRACHGLEKMNYFWSLSSSGICDTASNIIDILKRTKVKDPE